MPGLGESQRDGSSLAFLRVAFPTLLLFGLHKLERCHHASVPIDQSLQAYPFACWLVAEKGDVDVCCSLPANHGLVSDQDRAGHVHLLPMGLQLHDKPSQALQRIIRHCHSSIREWMTLLIRLKSRVSDGV
jgi:hypothetical protein